MIDLYCFIITDTQMLKKKLEETVCKICLENDADYIVFPCAHLAYCIDCVLGIKRCSMCRTSIECILKVVK
jgi:hypothetical protein